VSPWLLSWSNQFHVHKESPVSQLLLTVWKPKVMFDFTLSLQPVIQFMTLLPAPCFEEVVSTFADEVRNAFDRTATRVRSRVHFRQFQTFGNLSDYGHIQWAVFNSCSTEWSGLKCGEIFDLPSNFFMMRRFRAFRRCALSRKRIEASSCRYSLAPRLFHSQPKYSAAAKRIIISPSIGTVLGNTARSSIRILSCGAERMLPRIFAPRQG